MDTVNGPAKIAASLSVFERTVTEQQGVVCREIMRHMAGLSDKAADNLCCIGNNRSGRDNEVLGDHTVADIYRSFFVTVYRSVFQACAVFDGGVWA